MPPKRDKAANKDAKKTSIPRSEMRISKTGRELLIQIVNCVALGKTYTFSAAAPAMLLRTINNLISKQYIKSRRLNSGLLIVHPTPRADDYFREYPLSDLEIVTETVSEESTEKEIS